MTEREKMVEEMAKEIALIVEKEFREWAGSRKTLWGFYEDTAYAILDKCYRKIPDGAVVPTKEEYERLASYISEGRAREIFHEETEKLKEKIRKETAKEIYENFIKGYFRWDEEEFEDSFKEFIVKEYGVEVEE